MSIIGRGSKSIRKQDVVEQKSVSLAFKKIVFAHQANSGEAGITVTSLVAPPDMTAKGFVNPSASVLTRANIYQNKNNLKIVSSLSGLLIPYLSYTVNSSTYIAFNGFTASQDEVFTCYLDDVPTTSLSVVDGAPIIASGTLLAGQTDFNIGTPIEINKYSSQQIGAVMVYLDRGLQYRKVGNISTGDGDYIEVPVAGGLGSIIRFDAAGTDRFVTVISNGVVAERPSGSMTAMIENVQGQIDQIVPTVAALAGVSQTNFQISPNSVDLKQFGDTVISNNTLLNLMKTINVPVVTNWQSFTPTGSFTNTTYTGYWRRVGENMEVQYKLTLTGTPASATLIVNIPFGLTIDINKVADLSSTGPVLGQVTARDDSAGQGYKFYPVYNNTTSLVIGYQNSVSGTALGVSNSSPIAFTTSDTVSITVTVPIAEWSSTQTIAQLLGL